MGFFLTILLFTTGSLHTLSLLRRNTSALPIHLQNHTHPSDSQAGKPLPVPQPYPPTTPCIAAPEHTLQRVITYLKMKLIQNHSNSPHAKGLYISPGLWYSLHGNDQYIQTEGTNPGMNEREEKRTKQPQTDPSRLRSLEEPTASEKPFEKAATPSRLRLRRPGPFRPPGLQTSVGSALMPGRAWRKASLSQGMGEGMRVVPSLRHLLGHVLLIHLLPLQPQTPEFQPDNSRCLASSAVCQPAATTPHLCETLSTP